MKLAAKLDLQKLQNTFLNSKNQVTKKASGWLKNWEKHNPNDRSIRLRSLPTKYRKHITDIHKVRLKTHTENPDLIISESQKLDEAGKRSEGSFAARDFKQGERIRFLTGNAYSKTQILDMIESGTLENDDPLQIAADKYIILDDESLKFNHSCDPNTGIREENELIAIRDIEKGEELRFDYSTTAHPDITPEIWTMDCSCGADNCREEVQNISTIPAGQLRKYYEAGGIPKYLVSIANTKINE